MPNFPLACVKKLKAVLKNYGKHCMFVDYIFHLHIFSSVMNNNIVDKQFSVDHNQQQQVDL